MELELQRRTELHELEERKNSQINQLIANHEKSFGEMKNYYNDITLNNLALINTLKAGVMQRGAPIFVRKSYPFHAYGWINMDFIKREKNL